MNPSKVYLLLAVLGGVVPYFVVRHVQREKLAA